MLAPKLLVTAAAISLLTVVPSMAQPRPTAVTGWQVVYVEDTFAPSYTKQVVERCPPGKHILGGGYFPKDGQGYLRIVGSWPSDGSGSGITTEGSSWVVYATNTSTDASASILVYAICAITSP
jgi:hypothetical protein